MALKLVGGTQASKVTNISPNIFVAKMSRLTRRAVELFIVDLMRYPINEDLLSKLLNEDVKISIIIQGVDATEITPKNGIGFFYILKKNWKA